MTRKNKPYGNYSEETIKLGYDYIANHFNLYGDVLPCRQGLAEHMGVSTRAVQKWLKDDDKEELKELVEELTAKRERRLINGSLSGELAPSVAIRILAAQHGYTEKQSVDHTTNGESLTPTVITRVIVDPSNESKD